MRWPHFLHYGLDAVLSVDSSMVPPGGQIHIERDNIVIRWLLLHNLHRLVQLDLGLTLATWIAFLFNPYQLVTSLL